jgi:hypothetical protein
MTKIMEPEIISELIERKTEIIMTVEIGDKNVPELQKRFVDYDYFVLIEHKPKKFRWFDAKTGEDFLRSYSTEIDAISYMIMSGLNISYASPRNMIF